MSVVLECEFCNKEFEVRNSRKDSARFCSYECTNEWKKSKTGKNNPNYGNGKSKNVECDWCGKKVRKTKSQLENYDNHFCGEECNRKWQGSKTGRKNNRWKGKYNTECEKCNKEIEVSKYRKDTVRFCSQKCKGRYEGGNFEEGKENIIHHPKIKKKNMSNRPSFAGKNNPNWKGGVDNYYGENWEEMREKAMDRDDRQCVVCKRGKEEIGYEPDVHHIKPLRTFDSPEQANHLDNLITLCRSHHQKIERWNLKPDVRDKW